MKILWGIGNNNAGWQEAARRLGHDLAGLDRNRPFDGLRRSPDLAVVNAADATPGSPLWKALAAFQGRLTAVGGPEVISALPKPPDAVLSHILPAVDAPPDLRAGAKRPEFSCDVAMVGRHHPDVDPYLDAICSSRCVRVKVFGSGGFRIPQYLGEVAPGDVLDIYASALLSLDLMGNPECALAIWAAGGFCISTRKYQTGIPALDQTPVGQTPADLVGLLWGVADSKEARDNYAGDREEILGAHTYQHRLAEVLSL